MSHLTVAVSERGFQQIFAAVVEHFEFEDSDGDVFGLVEVGYDVKAHLENGSFELTGDGTVKIEELDIIWERLIGQLAFHIPPQCVGGGCIDIGFEICLPEWCIFEGDPDLALEVDIAPFVRRSEISGELLPNIRYFEHPDRPADMNYLDAQETLDDDGNALADEWRVHLEQKWLDADPIDIADEFANIIVEALEALVDNELSFLPGWARDLLKAIIGVVGDFVRTVLDIPDDFDEWLSDIFNFSFGLGDLLLSFLADWLANEHPILQFENPLQIMDPETDPDLIPVKIPVEALDATINTDEMIITANIGASL